MHADLALMLLADSRLPVAGHTQSGTVEAALQHGLGPTDIPSYLVTRLRTVTAVEAATAVVAAHLLTQDAMQAVLLDLEHAWAARSPSPALRAVSHRQARALLRLAARTWPTSRSIARVTGVPGLPGPSRATALGAVAAHLGLSGRAVARLVGYDDVQTVCAASLKLLPLDPATVTGWVVDALPAVDALAEAVGDLTHPDDLPASGNPLIEAWAQAHAASTRRLFHA